MTVTIRDVARHAGVSTATASRALTGAGSSSPAAQERVHAAAEALGYRVNKVARSLRTRRTDTLGLLIPDVRNPFFAELAYWVEQAAAEHRMTVITMSTDERADRQAEALRTLAHQRVDGLVVVPQGGAPGLQDAAGRIPMVHVDREGAAPGIPLVRSDNVGGARQMVDHLVDAGHRDIALIAGPQTTSTGRDRLRAALGRLDEHGCRPPDAWVLEGDFQLESGLRAAAALFDGNPWPTAVFAADNLMAVGALMEARRRDIRIGHDVALAAFDDAPWFAVLDPPLTALAQDVPGLGRAALDALLAQLAGQPAREVLLPVRLVTRSSTSLPTARTVRRRPT